MFKKLHKNEKGFTLAELLIVVAIIGVLAAISIPIFSAQLEKAREATDIANLRTAYAEVSAELLTDDNTNASKTVQATQTQANWQTNNVNIAGDTNVAAKTKGNNWTVNVVKNASNNNAAEVKIN